MSLAEELRSPKSKFHLKHLPGPDIANAPESGIDVHEVGVLDDLKIHHAPRDRNDAQWLSPRIPLQAKAERNKS